MLAKRNTGYNSQDTNLDISQKSAELAGPCQQQAGTGQTIEKNKKAASLDLFLLRLILPKKSKKNGRKTNLYYYQPRTNQA